MASFKKIARRTFLIGSAAVAGGVAFGVYKVREEAPNPLVVGEGEATLNPFLIINAGCTLKGRTRPLKKKRMSRAREQVARGLRQKKGERYGRREPGQHHRTHEWVSNRLPNSDRVRRQVLFAPAISSRELAQLPIVHAPRRPRATDAKQRW